MIMQDQKHAVTRRKVERWEREEVRRGIIPLVIAFTLVLVGNEFVNWLVPVTQ